MNNLIQTVVFDQDSILGGIIEFYKRNFHLEELSPEFESMVSGYLEELRDDCWFMIEYPYVDKLYRNNYYNFYASKHKDYPRDCIRVSLFSEEINTRLLLDESHHRIIQSLFLGYFIIEPTPHSPIGRSLISPLSKDINHFITCTNVYSAAVRGVKFKIEAFPHAKQNKENMTCAETSLWVIMDYFSQRYSFYKSILPSDINICLNKKADERLLPSEGLTPSQLSYALKEFGFGSKSYSKSSFENLHEIMNIYISSGIPFIGVLNNSNDINDEHDVAAHAVVICGKSEYTICKVQQWEKNDDDWYDAEQFPNEVIIMDDHEEPYKMVNLDSPYQNSDDDIIREFEFKYIVVPLYPKIYLEAVQAKALAIKILHDPDYGYQFNPDSVRRFYLSSSRSYKMHIYEMASISHEIKDLIVRLSMPKLIWCMEVYDSTSAFFEENGCSIILIDATEVNKIHVDSLLLASYPDKTNIILDGKMQSVELGLGGYKLFHNNLN